jgi:hypothetical protein
MKNLTKLAFYSLLMLFIFSCDEVEKLADIDFPVTLVKSLPVDVTSTDEMTATIVLDATTNTEIQKYINNIKGYKVTELLFAIENYSADSQDEIYFDGALGFSKKSEDQASDKCEVSPLNVTHVAGTGDFEISTCTAIVDEISNLLKQDNAVNIYMIGEFTKAPLEFDLKVTATVTVTANPL